MKGEMGIVSGIDPEENVLTVDFPGIGSVDYEESELGEIVLAYATSIHKSQGSEYPFVVVPVHTQHFIMLQRNLIYTAITRGKKLVVLAGTKQALAIAIKNNKVPERYSHLAALLREIEIPDLPSGWKVNRLNVIKDMNPNEGEWHDEEIAGAPGRHEALSRHRARPSRDFTERSEDLAFLQLLQKLQQAGCQNTPRLVFASQCISRGRQGSPLEPYVHRGF